MSKYIVQVNGKARWFYKTKIKAKAWARRWSMSHHGQIDVVYRQSKKGKPYVTIATFKNGLSKPPYMQAHRWRGARYIKARRTPRRRR